MKKFLVAAAAALMLVTTTAPAKAGSDWVAPAIFGTIFGVIIANNHGHADTVVVERHRHRHGRHHRRWNNHPRPIWVKKCGPVAYGGRDRWGDYTIIHRHECRMVKKMRW